MKVHAFGASLVFLLSAMGIATPPAESTPSVDQQQPVIDDSVGALAINGASEQIVAQVFTVGLNGSMVEVDLPIACESGDPLILQIQGVSGGMPDGSVLRSETYDGAGLPSFFPDPPELRPFALSVPLAVTAGEQLAIVLSSPGACGVFQGPVGDPYPGGDGWFDARPNPPGVWLELGPPLGDRSDLPFATLLDDRLDVAIDFMPGSRRNRINPRRGGRVAVAVLSGSGFDATTVDWSTAELGAGLAPALGPGLTRDVNGDGNQDLVLWFRVRDTGITCGDTSITLLATTSAGDGIRGVDAISVVGCGHH
jgi:hypothetical protein